MPVGMLVEVAMLVAAIGLGAYAIVQGRRHGRSVLDVTGLRISHDALPDLLAGFLIAGGAMLGIYLTELSLGAVVASGPGDTTLTSLALTAIMKFVIVVKEEVIMRGLLLSGLLLLLKGRAALAIGTSALAFGLIHLSNPGATPMSVIGNSLGGVIYGLAFVKAGNLWFPIGLHFAWNVVQGPVLGFPVSGMDAGGLQRIQDLGPAWISGGAYGPEAGAVGIAFRFVIIAAVLWWLARARKPLLAPAPLKP